MVEAKLRWNGKMGFVGVSGSNHAVVMDVRPESGGDGTAPSPMELVLMALGGCSGVDVAEILRKKRLNVRDFQIILEGERAEDYPKVFTKVQMTFVFEGEGLTMKPLEDAVRLSLDKYCSVAGMVGKTADIQWKVEIRE
ncbi:MAG TPA: OsmC family protein [Limnochordia bacterium]|jgi:putative redox protein|nr:OsmC family protein [Limnochordia bacterium]HOL99292.1 OsmC family protein [Limnochordia bacterium]HPP71306.1 OsmC family protein [Limnochordia bacterium]